ncbi:MAG: hypothetical protein HKN29_03620 [Rhodothermales bacterium]|nr:hypothetical protein [Rhodothermales bacterium]
MRCLLVGLLALAGCTAPDQRAEETPPDTLRILAYNIHHGEGMDGVTDLDRIAALIREVDPDLVALQEVDSVVARTGGVDQAKVLGELTGLAPVFGRFMPYQGGAYGMALLSALPLAHSANLRLPDGDEPRTAVSAQVLTPGGRLLRFTGIHFYRTEEERVAQASRLEELLTADPSAAARAGAGAGAGAGINGFNPIDPIPEILAGDFNSEPGGAVMTFLGERWTVLPKGDDRFTFSSFDPVKEIDFVLIRPEGAFEVLRHSLLDEPVMSDHRPLVADLVLR